MKTTLLTTLALAAAFALAGCGSDSAEPAAVVPTVVVPVDVATVGADLALPASAAASAAAAIDPLADLAELAPPDTSATALLPDELLPPT